MRKRIHPSLLVLFMLSFACETPDDNQPSIKCEQLQTGLINYNDSQIKAEIEKITRSLEPRVTDSDQFGHRDNFDVLINHMNNCHGIFAELLCYGCIETHPVQSEISVRVDSSGTDVYRVIDVFTPADSVLVFGRTHK